MKKKYKALIVAASIAAVAGIGAVSFAFWSSGGGGGTMPGAGNTGNTVEVTDGITVTYNAPSDGLTGHWNDPGEGTQANFNVYDSLVPYDQVISDTPAAGQAKLTAPAAGAANVNYMSFTIGAKDTFTYKISGYLGAKDGTDSETVGSARLMYKVESSAATAAPQNTAGYKTITKADTAMDGFSTENCHVTVILVAGGVDAKNISWNLKFSAGQDVAETGYEMRYTRSGETTAVALTTVEANEDTNEKVVYLAKGVELNQNDTLDFSIKGSSVTTILGDDSKDHTKAGGATVSGAKTVKVNKNSTYDVYLKQYNDTADGTWYIWVKDMDTTITDTRDACTSSGCYIVGMFTDLGDTAFVSGRGYAMEKNGSFSGSGSEYMLTIELKVGDIIKVRMGDAWVGYNYGSNNKEFGTDATANFKDDGSNDHNIEVVIGGTYNIYYKTSPTGNDTKVWIAKA